MEPRNRLLLDQYRQRFGGMNVSDEDMLRIITTITAISSSIVDDLFRELLANPEPNVEKTTN